MSFDDIAALPSTGLVITGQNDEIAPPGRIQAYLDRWGITPRVDIIPGCDHFYSGSLAHLKNRLSDYLS
jgi:hypothetical protein